MSNQFRRCACPCAIVLAGVMTAAPANGAADDQASSPTSPLPTGESTFRYQPTNEVALAAAGSDGWRFEFTAWLWLAGIEGDIGVPGLTADVDASFTDILDSTDTIIGIAGRLEIGCDKWGAFVDGMYMRLGVEHATGPLGLADVDVITDLGIVDFGLMYRVAEWPAHRDAADAQADLDAATARMLSLDVYAGARYTLVEMQLDPAMAASREADRDWFDPIVGGRFIWPFARHWRVQTWGDVGGFGASSDFTWSATGVLGFDFELFGLNSTIFAGYRAIGWDYTDDSGADQFVWDVIMHGPILGFTMRF